jgi:hypothetical protein
MSDLDILIAVSRSRLIRLEEHLQFEKEKLAEMEKEKLKMEKEKRDTAFGGDEERMGRNLSPLHTLEGIVEKKRSQIKHNRYSKSIPSARFYDMEKLEMLEPIFEMLKSIDERLEAIENKN